MSSNATSDKLRVLAAYGDALERNVKAADASATQAEAAIESAESLLRKLGGALPNRDDVVDRAVRSCAPPRLRSWEEIVADAKAARPDEISFADILSVEERAAASARLSVWNSQFGAIHQLSGYDYAVAGVAGIFAALADILLVKVPRHPGFLGGAESEGGWLSNIFKEKFGAILPEDTIRELERGFRVPYDASTNRNLREPVAGLGPTTHRMSSLGHDPILGWYFGVRDILAGGFTAIGSDGRLVIQSVPGVEPAEFGVELFVGVVTAFQKVGGHMLSDVATKAGLPPPLFGLLQFLQHDGFGDHSVSDIARAMYRNGYDLRHCLAGGVTVAIIEVFVRTAWTARELSEGKTLAEALPMGSQRLQSTLFAAHCVATAVNAGKVAVTQNPLSINWAQWLAFFQYLLPRAHWLLIGRESARAAFVQEKLDKSWMELDAELASVWARAFDADHRAVI